MKKKLLLVVLALAILTSLTAGTLAVYTRTVTETEQIEAKRFAFSASGSIAGENTSINLAPTEKMEYDFSIANVDTEGSTQYAEVPLQFDVTINYAEAYKNMPGLKATLYLVTEEGTQEIGSSADGVITYTAWSEASKLFDHDYKIVLEWVDDKNSDRGQTTAGSSKVTYEKGLTMNVVATQYFPAT